MDERLLERLNALLSRLSRPVELLDGSGRDVLSGRPSGAPLPEALDPGEPLRGGGQVYLRSEAMRDLVWMMDAEPGEGAGDRLLMADAVLSELLRRYPNAAGAEYLYRQLLLNEAAPAELEAALRAAGQSPRTRRCVMLMQADAQWHGDLLSALRAILPAEPSDVLVLTDRNTVAYLVDMSGVDGRSELIEYASAAQESALSETGCALLIGIGGCASDLVGLPASYDQALQALRIGRVFLPNQTLFDYEQMLMPRFLAELPPELAAKYHYQLFSADTAKLLTDELLETAAMFFEKDLNLSDTARQLYIHRNTLTYRLDKIERITGLDLRRFDDAVTFRMLFEMKKCIKDLN